MVSFDADSGSPPSRDPQCDDAYSALTSEPSERLR